RDGGAGGPPGTPHRRGRGDTAPAGGRALEGRRSAGRQPEGRLAVHVCGLARGAMKIPVAIMAKVPAAGEGKTRLCPPLTPAQAAALARCFLQDRIAQLGAIPTVEPVVAFTPPEREPELRLLAPNSVRLIPQQGVDLGARLDRLLTDLVAEGGNGAIA